MNWVLMVILSVTVTHAGMVGDFAPLKIGYRWTYVGESNSASVDAPHLSNFHSQVKRTIAITGMSDGGNIKVYVGIILDSCSEVRLNNVALGDTVMQKEFVLSEKDNRLSVLSIRASYVYPSIRTATSFDLDPLPLLQHGFQTHTFQDSLGSNVNHSGQSLKWITDSSAITIPPATGLSLTVHESIRCDWIQNMGLTYFNANRYAGLYNERETFTLVRFNDETNVGLQRQKTLAPGIKAPNQKGIRFDALGRSQRSSPFGSRSLAQK